ncbi:MAG: hypothetical protein LAO05_10715 [Acidobacteriia bacterium]|nr:hypothetical protein [Terriglobia bacterium]
MHSGGPDSSKRQDRPDRARAFHEAGHAVVCVLEGKPLSIVSMTGGTHIPEPEEVWPNDFWGVRVALAGFVADYISSGDSEPLTVGRLATGAGTPGAEHDFMHARRLASQAMDFSFTPDAIRDCLLEQMEEVRRILEKHWPAVQLVAAELSAAGELTGKQVAEFVGQPGAS